MIKVGEILGKLRLGFWEAGDDLMALVRAEATKSAVVL